MPDDFVTITQMKKSVMEFCDIRDWDQYHSPKDLAIGIVTEASELLEFFRFKNENQIDELLKSDEGRTKIGEELADVLYFLIRFAQMNEFDLSDELIRKLAINEERYPIEKARGLNKKYDEL